MLAYAKFIKDLVSKKWLVEDEKIEITHYFSAIMSITMVRKKKDPSNVQVC